MSVQSSQPESMEITSWEDYVREHNGAGLPHPGSLHGSEHTLYTPILMMYSQSALAAARSFTEQENASENAQAQALLRLALTFSETYMLWFAGRIEWGNPELFMRFTVEEVDAWRRTLHQANRNRDELVLGELIQEVSDRLDNVRDGNDEDDDNEEEEEEEEEEDEDDNEGNGSQGEGEELLEEETSEGSGP